MSPKELSNEHAHQEKRLDRIEEKIDKLSEAMVSLARTEEKILAMEQNNRNTYDRMNRLSQKLDDLEDSVKENNRIVTIITKLSWLVVAAVIGMTFKIILM
jgi:predicted  nucleic acid-binding Zn-ribbon protein